MTTLALKMFAEAHRVRRQAAAKWRDNGVLVMHGDLVEVEASDKRLAAAGLGRFKVSAAHEVPPPRASGASAHRRSSTAAAPRPWEHWHPPECPITTATSLRQAIDADDPAMVEELLDDIRFAHWDEACRAAGWAAWPATVAAKIATEMGMANRAAQLENVLKKHVLIRLELLNYRTIDLADPQLDQR